MADSNQANFAEFTESGYEILLDLARQTYRFATFSEQNDDRHVLWRHDVDFSVHRALRMAQIEHERGVVSTYFFMLRSSFYNLAEPEVLDRARRIANQGHRVGLHFQADGWPGATWDRATLEKRVAEDRNRLALLLDRPVDAVSFHNPEQLGLDTIKAVSVADLPNAYGRPLRDNYGYCSDSNGYWRFTPLGTVLKRGEHDRLQVLTHPAWWTPEPMPPRERVERCVLGRAAAVMRDYDNGLALHRRENVRR